ncbi:heme oxygenase isoform X2 [Thrips palmi]|uniref:Heme oxygenase n=1 Tax=Thrips palmi TaxID=161013 RepID=A0A6P8ZAP2_THRPL|nr:heme oxygenase isoform X2 [Thrips palmi]
MVWSPKGSADAPFNREMRKATRDIHAVSDALVNGKLALALSDNSVWADGLLVFYEIFRYLEEAMDRLRDKPLGELRIEGMERTQAFEADLKYYLGEDWASSYTPRASVASYLHHLMELEENDPDLLIAYVYHLYMGLLSGGQILRKKRQLLNRFPVLAGNKKTRSGGDAVSDFGGRSIYQMKKDLVAALNSVVAQFSEEKKKSILEESRTVFELNNTLVRSVKGVTQVILRNLAFFLAFIFMLYMLFKLFMF